MKEFSFLLHWIDWERSGNKAELKTMDWKSRKIVTMKHHRHRDADRLYLPRSIDGCGMLQLHEQLKKKKEHWKNMKD